jgi:hypothetical protein
MRDMVHHQNPTSGTLLFLPPPACDFEGVGSRATAFQTTVSDDNIEGIASERFVITNSTARASKLFRSRTVASLRRGLRKSRKVRLLVVIVSVELDRVAADQVMCASHAGKMEVFPCFLSLFFISLPTLFKC